MKRESPSSNKIAASLSKYAYSPSSSSLAASPLRSTATSILKPTTPTRKVKRHPDAAYEDEDADPTPSKRATPKNGKKPRPFAGPDVYAHLRPVQDLLKLDLDSVSLRAQIRSVSLIQEGDSCVLWDQVGVLCRRRVNADGCLAQVGMGFVRIGGSGLKILVSRQEVVDLWSSFRPPNQQVLGK